MPPLLMKLIFNRMPRAPMPALMRPIVRGIAKRVRSGFVDPEIAKHLGYLEGELGRNAWFAGEEFTAADIQMSFPLEVAEARAGLDERWVRLRGFLQRIHARPAYQRALERGGPYELLR